MQRLLESYRAIPADATVRLAKPTSNLFRTRAKTSAPGLDTSGLTGVISVDPEQRTADVEGMCTYEDLVAATLPYGLSPLVVPQLKTITLGGAVTGLGIESASFRNGLPHESVLEMDILTGTGEVVRTSADENPDLFRSFPNSYGTLGYSVRLKIELEPVKPFVALRHLRFDSLDALIETMDRIVDTGGLDGCVRERGRFAECAVPCRESDRALGGPQARRRDRADPHLRGGWDCGERTRLREFEFVARPRRFPVQGLL